MKWILNTSNWGKYQEFKRLFANHRDQLEIIQKDLKEIEADPVTVIIHKASQVGERVIVDDTSLDIEGADVGVNVRWVLAHLNEYVGRRARFRVLLAYRTGKMVNVYQGFITGILVEPRGTAGFGFDRLFQPDGETLTLAEAKPNHVNARAIAVEALYFGKILKQSPTIDKWDGPWQKDSE